MNVCYFFITLLLLFILDSVVTKFNLESITKKRYISHETSNYSLYKSYNITDLQELKSVVQHYNKFNLTKTKFLIIDWDEVMSIENKTFPEIYINIFYPVNTTINVMSEKKRISKWKLECKMISCTFGLKFIANNKHYSDLLKYNENIGPDYSFMIMFTVKNNRLTLKTISYGGHNYPLFYCPTKYWFSNQSNIVFYTHKSFENIVITESKQTVVPIFQQTQNAEFFVCGMLKQPMLADIEVGFYIKKNNEENLLLLENNNETLSNCGVKTFKDIHIIFTFLNAEFNYNGTNKVRRLYKKLLEMEDEYNGEVYYIYSYYNNGRIDGSFAYEPMKPNCLVKALKINEDSKIVPSLVGHNNMELFEKNNINYYLINQNLYNKVFIGKCLTRFDTTYHPSYDMYYSMAVELELKKKVSNNYILIDNKKVVFSETSLDSYGLYKCNTKLKSKSFLIDNVKVEDVYFIPEHFSQFYFPIINLKGNTSNLPTCKKSYGNFSSLIYMRLTFQNLLHDDINISINETEQTKNKFYSAMEKDFNESVNVTCTYNTIVDTIFETHQIFEYKKTQNKTILVMEKVLVYDLRFSLGIFILTLLILYIPFAIISYFCCKSSIKEFSNEKECKHKLERLKTVKMINDKKFITDI